MNPYIFAVIFLALLALTLFILYFKPKKKQLPESLYTKALNAIIQGDKKIAIKHLRDVGNAVNKNVKFAKRIFQGAARQYSLLLLCL